MVGWTGMRGVVALAAAISAPEVLSDGSAFPQRNLIIFLTFCVILVTLVLQGLTLPLLIRALGLTGATGQHSEEKEAQRVMIEAALAHLAESRRNDRPEFADLYDDIEEHYRQRLARGTGTDGGEIGANQDVHARYMAVVRELLRAEREAAVRLRNEGRINDEALRKVERELDLTEARLLLMS